MESGSRPDSRPRGEEQGGEREEQSEERTELTNRRMIKIKKKFFLIFILYETVEKAGDLLPV